MKWTRWTPGIGYGCATALGALGVAIGAVSPMAIAGDEDCVVPTVLLEYDALLLNTVEVIDDILYHVSPRAYFSMTDVSDPRSPVSLGSFDTGGPADLSPIAGIAAVGDTVYFPTMRRLHIVDISDPSAPVLLSVIGTEGELIHGVGVEGMIVFLALGADGVEFIDVSDPASPRSLGSLDTPGFAHNVFGADSVMYVADGDAGLYMANVGATPGFGSIDTLGTASDVKVFDGIAYIADGDNGLQMIDVHDISAPFLLGSFDTPGNARKIDVEDGTAYVSVDSFGVMIIDVTEPRAPTLLGSTGHGQVDVAVVGSTAFALGVTQTHVLDVTNTCRPLCDNPVDFNGDGSVDFFDISIWVNALFNGDLSIADLNGDGVLNSFDFSLLFGYFSQGCP